MSLDDNLREGLIHERDYWKVRKMLKQSAKELKEKLKHIRGCGRSCCEGFSDAFHCGDGHLCFECEYPINEAIEEVFGKGLV